MALGYVPENIMTYNMCLDAVRRNGAALEFVPEKFKSYEICLEAVNEYSLALELFVPDKFKNIGDGKKHV